MPARSRIIMAVASLFLSGMFFLPLWHIGLLAPQYPEGLGMVIEINTITGAKPYDLKNINELNHYIGMKVIDPAAIPELHFFPWIVGALIVLGLIAAAWGKRRLIIGWLGSLLVLAVAGGIDFWRWTYDYGHNLDTENAILKIPGAVYQPPILGSKQILNFTATSWPNWGVWCAIVAFGIGVLALWLARRSAQNHPEGSVRYLAPVLATVTACSSGPPPIAYNEVNCDFCGMTVSDHRFGATLRTERGKAYTFDSAECLVEYYLAQDSATQATLTMWVTDFQKPGALIPAEQAQYVYRATRVHSPMGQGLLALPPDADVATMASEVNGIAMSWVQLVDAIERANEETAAAFNNHGEHIHGVH